MSVPHLIVVPVNGRVLLERGEADISFQQDWTELNREGEDNTTF